MATQDAKKCSLEGVVTDIRWNLATPLARLGTGLRLAFTLRVLFLGAMGTFLMLFGWSLLDHFVAPSIAPEQFGEVQQVGYQSGETFDEMQQLTWSSSKDVFSTDTLYGKWQVMTDPFIGVIPPKTRATFALYELVRFLWMVFVWGIFGSAICRIAACSYARNYHITFTQSLNYAKKRYRSFVGGPLLILAIFAVLTLPIALGGLLIRLASLQWGVGLLWGCALVIGVILAMLTVMLVLGWPLMFAAVATEGVDTFGAISRAFSYIVRRPFYFFFNLVGAVVAGTFGWIFLGCFVDLISYSATSALSWGLTAENLQLDSAKFAPEGIETITFWTDTLRIFASGFVFGYFFVAMSAIYSNLRKSVDETEFSEVYLDSSNTTEKAYDIVQRVLDAENQKPKA